MTHTAQLRREEGQTLLIVAVALVGFVAMCAMAIDLTSLYAARSEIQRAANATALAGAKAFVDSGVMTDPSLQGVATTLATDYTNAAATQNLVANAPPQVVSAVPTFNAGNPTITVKLQRKDLPLFFSRIWGNNTPMVSATAKAEAYNPGQQTGSSSFIPSAPRCVKPLLFANQVPASLGGGQFVSTTSGAVTSGKQFVGQGPFDACVNSSPNCAFKPKQLPYLPMLVSSSHQYCPASSAPGCSSGTGVDFEQSIDCCDGTAFNATQCGTGTAKAWDPSVKPALVSSGLQCLIHSTGGTSQQDSLDPSAFASGNGLIIDPGSFSQTRYGLTSADHMVTSDSIITVPLFDNSKKLVGNQVTIVGFLTLFVDKINSSNNGTFSARILNVTGCGSNPSGTPISGGGVSAIPVRLIQ